MKFRLCLAVLLARTLLPNFVADAQQDRVVLDRGNSTIVLEPYAPNIVRVTLAEMTEERRRDFVKIVRGKGEEAKVAIRNIRRNAKDDLDALKTDVGEDELGRAEKELEAVTKTHVDAIDDALKRKESELLEV